MGGGVRGRLGADAHDVLIGREMRVADDLVIHMDDSRIRGAENRQIRLHEFPVQIHILFTPPLDRSVETTLGAGLGLVGK